MKKVIDWGKCKKGYSAVFVCGGSAPIHSMNQDHPFYNVVFDLPCLSEDQSHWDAYAQAYSYFSEGNMSDFQKSPFDIVDFVLSEV